MTTALTDDDMRALRTAADMQGLSAEFAELERRAVPQPKPDIPPGWESSYAIGDLLLAVDNWKASTPRNARPAFDDLVKACAALVAVAQPAA